MAIPGLTIFHVKSHLQVLPLFISLSLSLSPDSCCHLHTFSSLQKYRMSVFTREEDHTKGKLERSVSEMLPNFGALAGVQLNEALLIQMEAQRRLSDQLEVQKNLKMKIEAQGRFLDKVMEEFKNRSPGTKPMMMKPYSPFLSLPSLSEEEEESDQSNGKEFESDSDEVETSEITSKDEFRAPKRIKIQDNILPQIHKLPSLYPDSQNLNMFCLDGINSDVYSDQEIGYPWSVGSFSSPLLPAIYNPLNQ
ncbi:hypothetical protein ACS0TY_016362 [Phlomoides rotata]